MIRGQEEGTYALRISSLILHSVGQLLPHQIATGKFHTRDFIYPVSSTIRDQTTGKFHTTNFNYPVNNTIRVQITGKFLITDFIL